MTKSPYIINAQRTCCAFFLYILCSPQLKAQNLVPNYSFEIYDTCPYGLSLIYFAVPWFQPDTLLGNTTNSSSTDYYNSCASGIYADVPQNFLGFQNTRTGNGYAGIILFLGPPVLESYREYLEVPLADIMQPNKKYCVEFYANLANYSNYAVADAGLYFSVDTVFGYNRLPISFAPQITNSSDTFLTDTLNWMRVSGIYNAMGGEKFITIGNFKNDSATNKIYLYDTGIPDSMAYYYIDDVSVYEIDETMPANLAGADAIICKGEAVQIGAPAVLGFKYYWLPAIGLVNDTIAQTTVNPTQTVTYTLQITNDSVPYSCKPIAIDSVTVTVVQPVTIDAAGFAGEDTTLCVENNNGATLGTAAISNYAYSWQPTQYLNNANIAQPLFSSTSTSTLTYLLTITEPLCKTGTDTVTVSVIECDTIPNIVYIPNIFSPNGDGNNDYFKVHGANIVEGELTIYNRWGERIWDLGFGIWDLKDETKWWDGTYKGKPLNTGVFVYFCRVTYKDGTSEEKKGNVTLVR